MARWCFGSSWCVTRRVTDRPLAVVAIDPSGGIETALPAAPPGASCSGIPDAGNHAYAENGSGVNAPAASIRYDHMTEDPTRPRIALTADHNGTALKMRLVGWLEAQGYEVDDRASHIGEKPVDYPALCEDACRRVLDRHADRAIVIGGSGSGEQIACNKIVGIRAGLCHELFTAEISRAHNDANVLVMGAKVVDPELAEEIVGIWLVTAFKGERHQLRLEQIAALERGESLL